MPARTLPELKSADRAAFDHYLRTGERLTSEEWLGRHEVNFGGGNPHHDKLGRFASAANAVSPRGETSPTTGKKVEGWLGGGSKMPGRPEPRSAPAPHASRPPAASGDRDPVAKRQRDIGMLSAKFESLKLEGPGTISSGRNDPGGASYGTFQMSSKKGVVQTFVTSPEASDWTARFRGKAPATKAFDDEWRAIAASDPVDFEYAQRAFIVRENYSVGAQKVRQDATYDLERASPAVRQVFFSTAVQHGGTGGGQLFAESVLQIDKTMERSDPKYEPALINALYDRRTEQRRSYAPAARARAERFRKAGDFKNATEWTGRARGAENDLNNRYPRERYDALRLLSGQPMSGL